MDWEYLTEPSTNYCTGYKNNQCRVPRGKVLGGSSVLNYMLATRGNPYDYDQWEALGNPGWGFKDVLPYFIKAENNTVPGTKDQYHGRSGPLTISQSSYKTKLAHAFLEAGKQLGHSVGDYNGEVQTQFSYFQFTKKNGRRASHSRAYINPVLKHRKNLHVRVNAFVRRVIFYGNEAHGVEVEYNGIVRNVFAHKEIILSGGAINSPQILMLSGVGPKDHLAAFNITVVKDLPVGLNFQDHVSFVGLQFITNLTDNELNATCIKNDPKNAIHYVEKGYGPYEIPGGNEGVFFYDTQNPNSKTGVPDIEIHLSTVSPIPEEKVRGFRQDVYDAIYKKTENRIAWAIQPILMHPKSRGKIELRSANPHDKVKLFPNYLSDPYDMKMILKGIKKAMDISRTRAFQKFGSRLSGHIMPGCEKFKYAGDKYWDCVLRVTTITNYHQAGSCSMSPDGVVDPRLRVYGVSRLRVVDASIMPLVPAAHTNIPTTLVAERAADIIKQDYGLGKTL